MGFHVSYRFVPGTSAEVRARHLDEFIGLIEQHHLTCGGGGDESVHFFIAHQPRGSVSEEQRAMVSAWLTDCKEVEAPTAGPLVDAWHD